jgi:hypothetical protein
VSPRSFAFLWLSLRKRPGKICRWRQLRRLTALRVSTPALEIIQLDQKVGHAAGNGTALAWLMAEQLHVGA